MPLTVTEFVKRWKIASLSERSGSQSHFIDLCDMLGQPHPAAADVVGERFTFDKPLTKTSGAKGFADVWLRDHFAWEYKGKHKDLKGAYKQINDYREDLGNPPLLVVCDLNRFEVHTNFTSTTKRVYSFDLADLDRNLVTATCPLPPLTVLRALFTDTNALRPNRTDAFVTQEAAKVFARLAERLEIEKRSNTDTPIHTKEEIAHFLMRLLFCLFADSIDLLPKRVFRNLIQSDDRFLPKRFLRKLRALFDAMSNQNRDFDTFGEHTIKYFNGGLFDSASIIELDTADLAILHEATRYNWAHVAPEIFGTLFERSLNAERRSLIGAHYTAAEDILLLIEPVLMRPLERRWFEVRVSILNVLYGSSVASPTEMEIDALALSANGAASSQPGAQPQENSSVDDQGLKARLKNFEGDGLQSFEGDGLQPVHSAAPKKGALAPEGKAAILAKEFADTGTVSLQTLGAALRERRTGGAPKPPATSLLRSNPEAERLLSAWLDELTAVRVLDPACGSGNFLYLALRRLLDLWLEAQRFAAEHDISLVLPRMVSPTQLYGIETEFYAHELASIVVWIGFLQWKHEHGIIDDREPILEKLKNIEKGDAILRYDAQGKPYEPEWPPADFIIGNPPFLGGNQMRSGRRVAKSRRDLEGLGDAYVTDLRALYQERVPGGADLVTYWFEKARGAIEKGTSRRVGLIATNSIRMVDSRPVLDRIINSGRIFFAWSDRPWILEGASVRISLIAFDDGSDNELFLDGTKVTKINSDLTSDSDTAGAVTLHENHDLCFQGLINDGPFEIEEVVAHKMLRMPLNPNGRPNSDVIRKRIIGRDIVQRPSNGWVIDFESMDATEAALYELPFEYVKVHVKPQRDRNRRARSREHWWLHGENRPGMRRALSGLRRYVATPSTAKHRVFAWVSPEVLPDQQVRAIAREDDYFFGVLHSRIHETWSLGLGSTLEDRPRYSSSRTFSTFPFPYSPGTEPSEADSPIVRAIADAAREIVRLRDAWLNPPNASEADLKDRTLTKLYNARPAWLDNAHKALDYAVFAAYGWPPNLTDQEILARLLALNHERAAAQPNP